MSYWYVRTNREILYISLTHRGLHFYVLISCWRCPFFSVNKIIIYTCIIIHIVQWLSGWIKATMRGLLSDVL